MQRTAYGQRWFNQLLDTKGPTPSSAEKLYVRVKRNKEGIHTVLTSKEI